MYTKRTNNNKLLNNSEILWRTFHWFQHVLFNKIVMVDTTPEYYFKSKICITLIQYKCELLVSTHYCKLSNQIQFNRLLFEHSITDYQIHHHFWPNFQNLSITTSQ